MTKLAIAAISLFLLATGLVLQPSLAQREYRPEIAGRSSKESSPGKPFGPNLSGKIQSDARGVVASGEEAARSGVVPAKTASGPIYTSIPSLSAEQMEEREREMVEENLAVPIRQGENANGILAPLNPATEPISTELSSSSDKLLAPNDFTYQIVHDLSSTEAPNRSVIDEPSVGNMGSTVFFSGNWYAARSTDGGQSFTYVSPFNTFPSINGGFCCDQVVNYASNQDMLIWGLQYIKDSTSGTLRIARAVGSTAVANNTWVYYDFNPQNFGFASGNYMDFPTLSVSGTYLYATSNVYTISDSFTGSVIWRIPLSELAAGGTVHYDYLTRTDVGSLRCTDGAATTMYWGTLVSTSQVRIYRWDDGSGTVFHDDINITGFNYLNRDGVATSPDGTNWAARADSRIQAAWVSGGVIGLMWAAKQGGAFPYPYTVIDRFNQSNRGLISENQLWSSQTAWLYPAASVNSAGNLAGLAAYGGGTYYPGTNIWVSDDVQGSFNPLAVYGAAASNIGPSSNTWGDYQTIRRHKNNPNTWVASTHYLNAGSPVPRYLWFGRQRDLPNCSLAQLTSPANGSTIQSTSTFTWSAGTGNNQYWLYVGTSSCGNQIYSQDQGTATSRTVSNLPTGTIYVTVWSHCAGTNQWSVNSSFSYQVQNNCTLAQLTSPANGSTIQPTSTFTWSAGTGNNQYWLYVGTSSGGSQIYSQDQGTATSRTVSNLPPGTIYVTVWSHCAGTNQWSVNSSFSYQVQNNCTPAQLTSPANGSTIQPTSTFTWSAGTGNNQYWLYVGTSSGGSQIYSQDQGTATSRTVSNLPPGTIYVSVWSHCAGTNQWSVNSSFSYQVQNNCTLAQLTSPSNGSTIQPTSTFTWSAGTGNNQYWLYVGTTSGGDQILNENQGANTSRTVSNLPGGTIYVTVWSHCATSGVWSVNSSFAYSVQGGTSCAPAQITSPANGSTIASTTTFFWNTGSGNNQFWLYVGTTAGGSQIYNADQGTNTSQTVSGIPAGTIFVTLWSHCAGSGLWGTTSYTYTRSAGGASEPVSLTFYWDRGSAVSDYWPEITRLRAARIP